VGVQERDVHVRDPAVGRHPAEHADEVVEDIDGALLATANWLPEPYEYGSIRHTDSLLSLSH